MDSRIRQSQEFEMEESSQSSPSMFRQRGLKQVKKVLEPLPVSSFVPYLPDN
jgi:hypothetical protein